VIILHIDSSITGPQSVSRQLSAEVMAALGASHPDARVIRRDLGEGAIGHLTGSHLAAMGGGGTDNPALAADIAAGRAALAEFLEASVIVIGAPMYNFGVSSQLKAWIDRLAVAGQTFRYTENGPEGLAGGKKVIIIASRGGYYGPDTPGAAVEFHDSYLRALFGFFGIDDIEIIHAEGTMISPEVRESAIAAARERITWLAGFVPPDGTA
jgi:FMN-dependent NADH-azoreductase